ncbi:MAG TPA: hypothetical protein VM238_03120 [Phycisphaerae bacterium]|nr:hypothetical protein [Phycisphaerae bacterium]
MTDDTDECDEEPRLPEATPANDPGWCEYDGCLEFAKGDDGLCVKHLVAWRRGDAEAEAAHRRHLVKQPGACVDESKGGWKRQAAATGGQARPRPAGRDEALARRVPAAPAGGSPLAGTIVQEQAIELFRVAADAIGLPVAGFRVRGDVVVVNTENEQMVRIRDGRAEPVTIVPVAAVV